MFKLTYNMETKQRENACSEKIIMQTLEYNKASANVKWSVSIASTRSIRSDARSHLRRRNDLSEWNFAISNAYWIWTFAVQFVGTREFSIIFHYYDSCLNISVSMLLEIKRENISRHKSRLVCLNCWWLQNGLDELKFFYMVCKSSRISLI